MTRWSLAIILLSCWGCIDTLDLEVPSIAGRLVIDGFVERGQNNYHFLVTVSSSQPTDESAILELRSANIEIWMDGDPTFSLSNGESTMVPIHQFHEMFGGAPETAQFRVRVQTGSATYESSDQRILDNPSSSQLGVTVETRSIINDADNIVEKDFAMLTIDAKLDNARNEKVSLRWEVSGVYIWPEVAWTDNPFFNPKICYLEHRRADSQVHLINATEVSGNEIRGFVLDDLEVDLRFARAYVYTVLQKTLTPEATSYWTQISSGVQREGSIFDVPAGRAASNITNIDDPEEAVLGFFYGTAIDTVRMLASPGDVGFPRSACAIDPANPACCDCLLIPNASATKPPYWPG